MIVSYNIIILIELFFLHKCFEGPLNYEDQTEWPGVCSKGKYQSPINLPLKEDCEHSQDIIKITSINYNPINDKKINFAHHYTYTIDASSNGNITILLNNKIYVYELNNIHFHLNSEHTVNEQLYQMEMHMVHILSKENKVDDPDEVNKYLVIGIIFTVNNNVKDNVFISKVNFDTQKEIKGLDPSYFVKKENFYYYHGGLTTPGCDEKVNWIVMGDIYDLSQKQFEDFKNFVSKEFPNGNNRNIQPINGRLIYYIQEKKKNTTLAWLLFILAKLLIVGTYFLFFHKFSKLFL